MVACASLSSFLRPNDAPSYIAHTCLSSPWLLGSRAAPPLAVVSSAALNTGAPTPLPDPALSSSGFVPRSGVAGSDGKFYW